MSTKSIENALEGMDAFLVKAFNENVMPGLAVGVVHDGKLVYGKTFGLADIEKNIPITLDTVFRVMSISKTFTSIGIMQLWEQKKFDLDDPVNPYLKALKVQHRDINAPQITFRHLLTHTSGVGEMRSYSDMLRRVGGLGAKADTRILSMPEYYNGLLQAEVFPGEKWAYANHAFAVLAQVIEDISGEPFVDYMRRHIFEPLGMEHSDYFMSERVRADLAQGYQFKKDRFAPVEYLRLNTPGCGGIFSNVTDMVRYVSALMAGGRAENGQLLHSQTLKLMMTPQLQTDARLFGMGLGFMLKQYGPYLAARHGGGWHGFISEMTVIPEKKLAVLVFTNSSSSAPALIARDMLHRILELPDPLEVFPAANVLQNPAGWAKLCGSYGPKPGFLTNWRIWEGYGGEVEVFVKDGQLMARGLTGAFSKGFPLQRADPQDERYFIGKAGKQLIPFLFHENASGEVTHLDMAQYALYKRPRQQSLRFKAMTLGGGLAGILLMALGKQFFKRK